jgi:hypothetical protein
MMEPCGGFIMATENPDDLRQRAWTKFHRDLPRLYAERPGQWVAYRGEHLLGFNTQQHLLYQQCLAKGLQRNEFIVFCIEPEETEIYMGPITVD